MAIANRTGLSGKEKWRNVLDMFINKVKENPGLKKEIAEKEGNVWNAVPEPLRDDFIKQFATDDGKQKFVDDAIADIAKGRKPARTITAKRARKSARRTRKAE
jgi:hypothetical protein